MPCTGTILPSESNNYRIRTCFTCQHSILSPVAQYLTPASKSKCLPSTHPLCHNFDRCVFFDILRWRCGYESISLVKKRLNSHLRLSITNIRAILYILHVILTDECYALEESDEQQICYRTYRQVWILQIFIKRPFYAMWLTNYSCDWRFLNKLKF
jgi:hypothetical protein